MYMFNKHSLRKTSPNNNHLEIASDILRLFQAINSTIMSMLSSLDN